MARWPACWASGCATAQCSSPPCMGSPTRTWIATMPRVSTAFARRSSTCSTGRKIRSTACWPNAGDPTSGGRHVQHDPEEPKLSRGVLHTPAVAGICAVCGRMHPEVGIPLLSRLWVYTNYDCNLHCSYCLVSSSPSTPRRGLPLETFCRLIDEAVALGCEEVFLTGGEPAILPHIAAMIAYATPRLRTTMLPNGML